jgi:hypothetical protein
MDMGQGLVTGTRKGNAAGGGGGGGKGKHRRWRETGRMQNADGQRGRTTRRNREFAVCLA